MDFREGGYWHYAMVGPEGEEHWALANYKTIDPRRCFTALDGFADTEGVVNTEMLQSDWEISFTPKQEVTLVENLITFDDLAQLETTIQMGFKEGLTAAMENLDQLLAAQKQEA
ncbi:PhnB protein [Pontibacter indicus]|uniref:PhnB protein n=1 Tax=Pontibacter indicus TaxID=1317125 RepID=A0A1R3WZL6_9BACT|nr:SRPBCC domain-containing protein [Pontibacter indicus]SIT83598.1 PhnB protein [Pontibacter indicus]